MRCVGYVIELNGAGRRHQRGGPLDLSLAEEAGEGGGSGVMWLRSCLVNSRVLSRSFVSLVEAGQATSSKLQSGTWLQEHLYNKS